MWIKDKISPNYELAFCIRLIMINKTESGDFISNMIVYTVSTPLWSTYTQLYYKPDDSLLHKASCTPKAYSKCQVTPTF